MSDFFPGHQKKFTLAIERLKKLGTSSHRLSNVEQNGCTEPLRPLPVHHEHSIIMTPPPANQLASRLTELQSHNIRRWSSGENISNLRHFSNSPDARVSEIIHLTPSFSPLVQQPEVVAIQVNHSWSTSSAESDSPMTYESFHGNPMRDFHSLRSEADGDMTPTNDKGAASADEMEPPPSPAPPVSPAKLRPQIAPKPKIDCRTRRASGGLPSSPESPPQSTMLRRQNSCRGPSQSDVCNRSPSVSKPGIESSRPVSAGSSCRSAPNTPAHALDGASKRTAPPMPPKRTNSIKGDSGSEETLYNISEKSECHKNDMNKNADDSSDNPLSRVIERLEWKGDQTIRPSKFKDKKSDLGIKNPARNVQPTEVTASPPTRKVVTREAGPSYGSIDSNSSTPPPQVDSNTLPFANENVGTIRQKTPTAAPPSAAPPTAPKSRTSSENIQKKQNASETGKNNGLSSETASNVPGMAPKFAFLLIIVNFFTIKLNELCVHQDCR